MSDLGSNQPQLGAAQLQTTVEDTCEALKDLIASVPIDMDAVPEEMLDWTVCPSMPFYAFLSLSSALESLEESRTHLRRVAGATPATVEAAWRRVLAMYEDADGR